MVTATMFEAKTKLSELVKKAQTGEKVIITSGRNKVPVVELTPVQPKQYKRLGALYNPKFELPDDFLLLIWMTTMVIEALLDTHVVLWAVLNPPRLSERAREAIGDERSTLYVSSASAYEIANKVRKGKLAEAEELERNFIAVMDEARFTLLPLDTETALRGGRLVGEHRDPWDRLIAAQALALDVPVISSDVQLDVFGLRRIW